MNFIEVVSDDEDYVAYIRYLNRRRRKRRIRMIRERINHFERWDDPDFFIRFRLSKTTVERIIHQIEEEISSVTDRYCTH